MNEQKIEELKNSLRQIIQMISERDSPLPEEMKVMLAKVIEHVANRIQELRSENPVEELQTPIPEVEQGQFPSSNINGYKYNPQTKELFVQFHDKYPNAAGPIYSYKNVPKNIYDVFSRGGVGPTTSGQNKYHKWVKGVTPSLGAALYHLIREGGYPYQRRS